MLSCRCGQRCDVSGFCGPAHSRAQLYANISSNGTIIYQHGIAQVTHPSTGEYCVLPSSTSLQAGVVTGVVAPVLTLKYSQTPNEDVVVTYYGPGIIVCPNSNYMLIFSYYIAPNTFNYMDAGFVLLWD